MVTIIACEVDTEVFTSDKMQVWLSRETHAATHDEDFALVLCMCGSFFSLHFGGGLPACCSVEVHARLADVECSSPPFYQWERVKMRVWGSLRNTQEKKINCKH